MRDMADARECLSPKAIRPELAQVLECLDLGRREPLAQNPEVRFLRGDLAWEAGGERRSVPVSQTRCPGSGAASYPPP